MSEPFLSEIKLMSFNFPPKGWAFCNGQLLPINQNQALFSLLGTTYGGNGQTTFALPDLRGEVPIHRATGIYARRGRRRGGSYADDTGDAAAHALGQRAARLAGNHQYTDRELRLGDIGRIASLCARRRISSP